MSIRFIADGMLGSLARKLRLYGLDVTYYPDKGDLELLALGKDEGRVLLTADVELHGMARRRGQPCVLISKKGDAAVAAQVFRETGLKPTLDPNGSRCPLCNGEVVPVEKAKVGSQVPSGVYARQERFYQCGSCHHMYWEGGHWFRLTRFDEQVKEALKG